MTKKNLIYISLDTLRADVAYSGALRNFARLVAGGTVFRNTVASAPLTPVSHASIFTGTQPFRHGLRHLFREKIGGSVQTMAQLARAHGYRTGAIVSCPGLNRWYGMNAGFQHYDDEIPRMPDGSDPLDTIDVEQRGRAMKRAPLVVERGLKWLDTVGGSPFFLFLHFFDTHWPYEPPEVHGPPGINPYEGEAHFVDHYLGRFIDESARRGLLENTLIVVFGDHGEDLAGWYDNDHAGEERGHPQEKGHGCLLFDATQMVPLAFVAPGIIPADRVVETQVRLVDIHPTVTELLGFRDPDRRCGESLVPLFASLGEHRIAYSETFFPEELATGDARFAALGGLKSLRLDNRYKIVVDVKSGAMTLFDLVQDPNEMQGIAFGS